MLKDRSTRNFAESSYMALTKTSKIVLGSIVLIIATIAIITWYNIRPIDLAHTDLHNANTDTKERAANQMSTPISNLPSYVDNQTKKFLENQLAYILRQKYGSKSTTYTASVRTSNAWLEDKDTPIYVDVPAANETYILLISLENHSGSFSCAPQDNQLNPETSNCEAAVGIDDVNFPNG